MTTGNCDSTLNPACSTMKKVPPAFRLGCVLAMCALPAVAIGQSLNLDDFERLDPGTLPELHRSWIEEEVFAIVTDTEREVFLRLDSPARRDDFIQRFWDARDPSPGTPRNEYREQHYERFQYVVDNLGRKAVGDGWRTDMGRIYVLLGKPQSVNRLPNTSQAVPIEVWFYNVDPAYGTPPFFYLIFFKDRGVGEYRLYSPAIDGPEKLLNQVGQSEMNSGGGAGGPGGMSRATTTEQGAIAALRRIDPELGNAAASLVPGDAAGGMVSPLRSEMVLSRIFDIPERLMPQAPWAYRVLAGDAEASVRFETLPLQSVANVLIDPTGLPFVHFATRTLGNELNLNNYEDDYYVTFEVTSAIRDGDLRVLLDRPTRTLQASLDEEAARRLRGGPVEYIERMPILEGSYFLDIMIENNLTRRFARSTFDLRVPNLRGARVDAAAPVLALETAFIEQDYDPFADQYPYQVGTRVLIPAVGGPVANNAAVDLYWQIYVPEERVEPVIVRVAINNAEGAVLIDRRLRLAIVSRGPLGLLEAAPKLDLNGFPPGDYRVVASIEDEPTLRFEMPLRVVAAEDFIRPFVHAVREPPADGVEDDLARARQMRTAGLTDQAATLLGEILRREPDNDAAFELQVDLLTDAGRFNDLAELIRPRLVAAPNAPDLLLQMGAIQAELGEHYDAIRYYERALLAGSAETTEVLNALGSEYFADEDTGRARELFERSLELDPEQPQIRRVLEELLGSSG